MRLTLAVGDNQVVEEGAWNPAVLRSLAEDEEKPTERHRTRSPRLIPVAHSTPRQKRVSPRVVSIVINNRQRTNLRKGCLIFQLAGDGEWRVQETKRWNVQIDCIRQSCKTAGWKIESGCGETGFGVYWILPTLWTSPMKRVCMVDSSYLLKILLKLY